MTKIIKKRKDYREIRETRSQLQERIMRTDLIETFKRINAISSHGLQFFNISPQNENLVSKDFKN